MMCQKSKKISTRDIKENNKQLKAKCFRPSRNYIYDLTNVLIKCADKKLLTDNILDDPL